MNCAIPKLSKKVLSACGGCASYLSIILAVEVRYHAVHVRYPNGYTRMLPIRLSSRIGALLVRSTSSISTPSYRPIRRICTLLDRATTRTCKLPARLKSVGVDFDLP
jgi:hypothetical protein